MNLNDREKTCDAIIKQLEEPRNKSDKSFQLHLRSYGLTMKDFLSLLSEYNRLKCE